MYIDMHIELRKKRPKLYGASYNIGWFSSQLFLYILLYITVYCAHISFESRPA